MEKKSMNNLLKKLKGLDVLVKKIEEFLATKP